MALAAVARRRRRQAGERSMVVRIASCTRVDECFVEKVLRPLYRDRMPSLSR
jgi:hypothetical protein